MNQVNRDPIFPTCRLGKESTGRERGMGQGYKDRRRTYDLKIVVNLQRSSNPLLTPGSSRYLIVFLAIWYMYKDNLHIVSYNNITLETILMLPINELKNYILYMHLTEY